MDENRTVTLTKFQDVTNRLMTKKEFEAKVAEMHLSPEVEKVVSHWWTSCVGYLQSNPDVQEADVADDQGRYCLMYSWDNCYGEIAEAMGKTDWSEDPDVSRVFDAFFSE